MRHARDRVLAAAAAVLLVALAAVVVILVLDAQRSGIETRESLRLEQIRAEAGRMETRIQQVFGALIGTFGAPGAFTMERGDSADIERLAPLTPDATTGGLLVDEDGTIVNGSLLRDQDAIGRPLAREGIDAVLAGAPALLPVAEGLTTSRPTLAIAVPVRDERAAIVGAVVVEVEVAPDSAFNAELAELRTGDTGNFSFVDRNGVVAASTDDALLGEPFDLRATDQLEAGFHRGNGRVAAIAPVPSAGWHAVFSQEIGEFEGDLTGPLQLALLLFLGAVAIVGVFTVVSLLRRLQAAREEQHRLREIGDAREEFTSIVSHELRTPVAGLLGFLQTTIDHWDAMGEAERRRAVGRAFTNARALQTLTSDVLDSANIEAQTLTYRFETVDLRGTVNDAVATLSDASPERPVEVDVPDQPVLVRADSLRLRQVLTNLLDNAAKSSAPDAPIDVVVRTEGGAASVSVRDRGPGIAVDERQRIFDKFTRGRAGISRGTGLGLYISRHIVEAHGGTITAESVAGEPGARLTFTLALDDQ